MNFFKLWGKIMGVIVGVVVLAIGWFFVLVVTIGELIVGNFGEQSEPFAFILLIALWLALPLSAVIAYINYEGD